MANDLTGTMLGRYQIVERLGRGGMAEVYRAYQPSMDRYVAIKVMHGHLAEQDTFVERFKREAQAVGTLRHPNIVQVIDFDIANGEYYMVMEFVQGDTLKGVLKRNGPFSVHDTLALSIKLANALAYAHDKGLIHRDIKPANVLMTSTGEPVLTDFGIARIIDASGLTTSGLSVGTPAYMSPEAGRGEKVGAPGDIYSFGVMMYEMLTGTVPYDADTPYAVILKHINDPLPTPRKFVATLPESVEKIILKTLAKDPRDRYQTAAELESALEKASSHLDTAIGSPVIQNTAETVIEPSQITELKPRTMPISTIAIGVGVVLLLIIGGVVFSGVLRPPVPVPPTSALTAAPTKVVATQPVVAGSIATEPPIGKTAVAVSAPNKTDPKYAALVERTYKELVQGNAYGILPEVEAALKKDPQSYDLLALHSLVVLSASSGGDPEVGKTEAQAAIKQNPERPEAYISLGLYYQFNNWATPDESIEHLKDAIKAYTQSIEISNQYYEAYWLRGKAKDTLNGYSSSNNAVPLAEIDADYESAASLAPTDTRFYLDRAEHYSSHSNLAMSASSLEQALALTPNSVEIQGYLGATYLRLKQSDKAFTMYSAGIAKGTFTDPKYLADAAYIARNVGKKGQALEWAKLAITLDANTAAANYVLGLLAWDDKNYQEAIDYLNEAHKSDRYTYINPYLNRDFEHDLNADRARLYTVLNQPEDAITAYGEAIAESENWVVLFIERAKLYIQTDNADAARADLLKAFEFVKYNDDIKTRNIILDLLKQVGPGDATVTPTP